MVRARSMRCWSMVSCIFVVFFVRNASFLALVLQDQSCFLATIVHGFVLEGPGDLGSHLSQTTYSVILSQNEDMNVPILSLKKHMHLAFNWTTS